MTLKFDTLFSILHNLKNNQPKVVIFYLPTGIAIPKFFWKIAVSKMYPKILKISCGEVYFLIKLQSRILQGAIH